MEDKKVGTKLITMKKTDGGISTLTAPVTFKLRKCDATDYQYYSIVSKDIILNLSISQGARFLYVVLETLRWYKTNAVVGNVGHIANTAGATRQSTKRWLDELEKYNVIKMTKYKYKRRVATFIEFLDREKWELPDFEIKLDLRGIESVEHFDLK